VKSDPTKQLLTRSSEVVEVIPSGNELAKSANPLVVVHSLLRGRYWLAICLSIVGASAGAFLGYRLVRPEYQSTGTVSFDLVVGRGASDAFLQEQMAWMKSSRVRDLAMEHPEWKALNRGLLPSVVAAFDNGLQVSSAKGSGLIRVTFTDDDPKAAATAVKAVIEEYKKFFADLRRVSIGRAEEDRRRMQKESKEIADRRTKIIKDQGWADELQKECEAVRSLVREVEVQLQQVEQRLSSDDHQPSGQATTLPAVAAATQPFDPAFEVVLAEKAFIQALQQQNQCEREIQGLMIRLRENHPQMIDARTRAAAAAAEVQRRKEELLRHRAEAAQAQAQPAPIVVAMSRDQLEGNRRILVENRTRMKDKIDALVATIVQLEQLDRDEADLRTQIAAIGKEIDELQPEREGREQISVVSTGDVPSAPSKDRRKALSAIGGLGLAGLGVAFVMLLGLLDRRLRHVDAARSKLSQIDRLLGVLPELPDQLSNREQSAEAAYCINHIRAMLQIRQRTTGHKTFAVTSPSPGDGKTSLIITLGMSFAASGASTLVIDCDFDGGGLSSRLHQSAESGNGIVGVLGGKALDSSIFDTGHAMLSLLPLGVAPGPHSGKLSPSALRRVLDRLEDKFDTILIDCGPILGSVEAAVVCAEADGTILLVSRGGDQNAAEGATNLLAAAGAEIEGIVFNRALAADVARSAYHSSGSMRSQRSSSTVADAVLHENQGRGKAGN
jgi:Mrp family chromosome partitioning ATPase/uncharacterized protein involved in exopolysaccharide biosynthesis